MATMCNYCRSSVGAIPYLMVRKSEQNNENLVSLEAVLSLYSYS